MQWGWGTLLTSCVRFHYKTRVLQLAYLCRLSANSDMSAQSTPIAISLPSHNLLLKEQHTSNSNFCASTNTNPSCVGQRAFPPHALTFFRWSVMAESSCARSLSFSLSLPQSTSLEPAAWKAFAHSLEETRKREKVGIWMPETNSRSTWHLIGWNPLACKGQGQWFVIPEEKSGKEQPATLHLYSISQLEGLPWGTALGYQLFGWEIKIIFLLSAFWFWQAEKSVPSPRHSVTPLSLRTNSQANAASIQALLVL